MRRTLDVLIDVVFWMVSPLWIAALLLYLAFRWMVTIPPGHD